MAERKRILIIDDSELLRSLFADWLQESGYDTIEAQDGREGIDRFHDAAPDLVICDLRMPEVPGMEVLEAIRTESPDTPVIIVSGSSEMRDAVQALKLGAWDYLLKPLGDIAVLDLAVKRSLERAALIDENRRYRINLEAANAELAESLRQLQLDEAAGRQVQFDLMPPARQRFDDLTITRWILPSSYLSGDFVDYFEPDDRHLGFFVADVAGHGVSSAFVTVVLHDFVNQQIEAYRQGRDDLVLRPAALVERLNTELLSRKVKKSLTIFYGVIDRERDRLVYANAGAFPYPIFHDGRSARFLEHKGFGVGHFDFATWEQQETDLPPQFTITIVSDGALEVMEGQHVVDKERALLDMLDGPAGRDVTIDSLMARLGLAAESELPDDITFLMVRREGA
ncbi:MAG: fused response regulator/phosphatase [Deltaproteobacteria bacterium]|nr:fused response regulator/phosphatase [Deltaproteobacteria bacterium]